MTNLRQMAEDEVIFRFESDEDKREFWELYIKNRGDRYNNHISNLAKLWECEDGKLYIDNYKYNLTHEYYPTWTETKERYEMKVKIINCSDNQWYTKRIGEIYEVDKECDPDYYSLTNGVLILKADTVPVSEIRYELKSTVIYDTCVTPCEHKKNTKVGSVGCNKCEYNCGNDKEAQTVQCSWQDLEVVDTVTIEGFKGMKKSYVKEESKEMKRLDIRKDYEDKNIGIKPYNELKYYWIEIKNNGHDIMAIKLGAYGISLNQANAILKVMGLDYELYEATDWSKVEEGAEVTWIEECIVYKAPNGVLRRLGEFVKYIPDIKKIVVRVGDEVKVVDEDKVELC